MPELEQKYINLKNYGIFIVVYIFLVVVLPSVALFGLRGLEERINFDKIVFYGWFSLAFLVFIGFGSLNQWVAKRSSRYYNAMGWLGSHVHNPELSLLHNLRNIKFFAWFLKQRNIIFLFIIISPLLGLLAFYTNTFLWDLPNIAQQILPIGEGILETEPAGTEVFGLFALVSLGLYIIKWLQNRNKWADDIFWALSSPMAIVTGGLYGLILHFWRYGGSEIGLGSVILFWVLLSILILLFSNIFVVWIYKDSNNLFLWLKETKFTNETVLIITMSVLFFIIIIYSTLLLRKKTKSKFMIGG